VKLTFSIWLLLVTAVLTLPSAWAGQAPGAVSEPDVPVSHRDRVYAAEQFSNTVSVTDAADNKLLGVIRLGDPAPGYLSPLYRGQLRGARHGLLSRSSHHRRRVDRLELGDLDRHGNQCWFARKDEIARWTLESANTIHEKYAESFCREIGTDAEGSAHERWDISAGAVFEGRTVVAESEPRDRRFRW
jgi:hypothetical protein